MTDVTREQICNLFHLFPANLIASIYRTATIKEAAEYFEVAEITVRRWVKDGILKHKRIGKNIVFDPDALKTFKQQRQD